MKPPVANAKCYLTFDRSKLVAEGEPVARILFAVAGESVNPKRLESISNADEFFSEAPISNQIQTPEDFIGKKRRHRA